MNRREAARLLGRRGGQQRARRLSAEDKRRIASLGGRARAASLEVARRMEATLRYAATVELLRPRERVVIRESHFRGRLPSIGGAKQGDD